MTMRAQRKRHNQMKELQSSLTPGQNIVTAGGLHGTVVAKHGEQIDVRVKDGTVMTFDTMAIVRSADVADGVAEADTTADDDNDERFPKL